MLVTCHGPIANGDVRSGSGASEYKREEKIDVHVKSPAASLLITEHLTKEVAPALVTVSQSVHRHLEPIDCSKEEDSQDAHAHGKCHAKLFLPENRKAPNELPTQ
jgi:hypothetical protein